MKDLGSELPAWSSMTTEKTWEISDIDGSNKRTVTLAQYRAELDAAKAVALAIYRAKALAGPAK